MENDDQIFMIELRLKNELINSVKYRQEPKIHVDPEILKLYMYGHGRDCTCFSGKRVLNTCWRTCEDCGAEEMGGSCFKRCEGCATKAYLKDIGKSNEKQNELLNDNLEV